MIEIAVYWVLSVMEYATYWLLQHLLDSDENNIII